jgi:hypothetical protein
MADRFNVDPDIGMGAERKPTPRLTTMPVVVIKVTPEQFLGSAPVTGDEPLEFIENGAQNA